MPVPEPMAPRKSANTDRAPMHRPPNAAAVGMYLQDRASVSQRGDTGGDTGCWCVIGTLHQRGGVPSVGWRTCPTQCWHADGDFVTQGRTGPRFPETSQQPRKAIHDFYGRRLESSTDLSIKICTVLNRSSLAHSCRWRVNFKMLFKYQIYVTRYGWSSFTVTQSWLHVRITWRTLRNNGIVFKILQKEGGRKPGGDGGWTGMAEWG